METSLHFCDGFYLPSSSNSSSTSNPVNLRIQNCDWRVVRRTSQYLSQFSNAIIRIVELQRPESSESAVGHMIMFTYDRQGHYQKFKKSFTFPKSVNKIEIEFQDAFNYASHYGNSVIGVVSVCFPDSCKTDDKKSKVGSSSSSDVISSQLSKDLTHLLDSDVSSDYVLKCADQEFHVHKCILAARSSVFAAMFRFHNKNDEAEDPKVKVETTSDMKQKKVKDCTQETSTVSNEAEDIMDIKPEILKKMLKYIYSGQIDDLTSTEAGDLLYAADKYQLDLLKKICVDKLKSTLSASNVLDILVIGDLHDESLKAHAMNFICQYPSLSELKKMDQWKSLQTTNPAMVIEVLTSVVGYLQDSKK